MVNRRKRRRATTKRNIPSYYLAAASYYIVRRVSPRRDGNLEFLFGRGPSTLPYIPDGCKIVLNLENKKYFLDFFNKNGIIWRSSQNF